MIGRLRGRVEELEPDSLILDVGGVGYAVRIPLSTYYSLANSASGKASDEPTTLRIHTHVREDALELFGFATQEEKTLFEKLIAVSGIGPKLAQVVLSGMAPLEVLQALASGDLATLTRIPGIGKKTAERMVVELRDTAGRTRRTAGRQSRPGTALPQAMTSSTRWSIWATANRRPRKPCSRYSRNSAMTLPFRTFSAVRSGNSHESERHRRRNR